ncbi:hypothetical protein GOP47_0027150 [Adiantum capillus-veneris]|nr:hypothetical protein GOP47_0027150 [Adiantum capillus-veneris]
MGEPSSSWQTFNFQDDVGSAQGMQALRFLLLKLQEAQENPHLKSSINNLLMTEDLVLTSARRPPSSVEPLHKEAMEEIPMDNGPMPDDGTNNKHPQAHKNRKGKALEEGKILKLDEPPPS